MYIKDHDSQIENFLTTLFPMIPHIGMNNNFASFRIKTRGVMVENNGKMHLPIRIYDLPQLRGKHVLNGHCE